MAYTGSAGKADGWIEVVDEPYTGPGNDMELPKLPHRRKWAPQVEAWWQQVRRMPHCVLWGPTDWVFAIETAYLKQDFWAEYAGDVVHSTKATEIRRREDQMGTTVEARRKLRIRYVRRKPVVEGSRDADGSASDAVVTDISSRRNRLAG